MTDLTIEPSGPVRPLSATRFATLGRWPALGLLVATAALIVYGLVAGVDLVDRTKGVDADRTDAALYGAVAARVGDGENYYSAVAAEHRERGYPLRPFVTVREPALAYATAAVGGPRNLLFVLGGLAFLATAAMVWRMETTSPGRFSWWAAAALTALTAGALVGDIQVVTHEVWAGMLIVLSLALRTEKRFMASVGFGLVAVSVRELALPYLVVMALFALREKKRRECVAWAVAIALFALAFVAHGLLVHSQTVGADAASQGWLRFGGWSFVLDLARQSSFLAFVPEWVAAVGIPLALLGWWSRATSYAIRVSVTVTGFLCAFMILGRPENVYWGILLVILLVPGIAFAPSAAGRLAMRLR